MRLSIKNKNASKPIKNYLYNYPKINQDASKKKGLFLHARRDAGAFRPGDRGFSCIVALCRGARFCTSCFSVTKIKDLDNNYAGIGGQLWKNGTITDSENTLLQQVGEFYASSQLDTA